MAHALSPLLDSSAIGIHPPSYRLPATAHVGRVRLAVSQLARAIDFYACVIGLAVIRNDGRLATLGAQNSPTILLELEEIPGVEPIDRRNRLGLYHTAFLLPSREALSSFVKHLRKLGVPFGAGDHLYSEALYLTDPDGLTVEVYADRDRATWILKIAKSWARRRRFVSRNFPPSPKIAGKARRLKRRWAMFTSM